MIVYIFIALVVGAVVGFLAAALIFRANEVGTLRIDTSHQDFTPYLFLEVNRGKWAAIQSSRYVRLAVCLLSSLPRR